MLQMKGLCRSGSYFKLHFESADTPTAYNFTSDFSAFNCTGAVSSPILEAIPLFRVYDGVIPSAEVGHWLEMLGQNSLFNYEQYQVEHADIAKNIIINRKINLLGGMFNE